MMKSNKGKTNFWSQLLLSMIAIFALPVAQGLEAPPSSNMSGENYQTSSEQYMLIAVREIRQALQVQPQPTNHKTHSNQKHEKIQPHFIVLSRLMSLQRQGKHHNECYSRLAESIYHR